MSYEYRIEYAIQRRDTTGDEDFAEIGFGSSGAWDTIDQAEHMMGSDLQNGTWESDKGQPEPADVMADIANRNSDA
jgi:hypothetical protein